MHILPRPHICRYEDSWALLMTTLSPYSFLERSAFYMEAAAKFNDRGMEEADLDNTRVDGHLRSDWKPIQR